MPIGSAIQSCPHDNYKQEQQQPDNKWIQFNIEDPKGWPVAGVTLKVKLSDGTIREAISDEDGIVYISNVPAGVCEIISNWKNFDVHSSVFIN
ncbi:carboxypeptidase-like regulatory domain-containing protein [Dyadobacter aurulentus]|uniref:carboxypeptidase-like regulatory domain-containing protein n=1 Tax=Dyadobacter sp. UC 10 TaxID=2605428 RepID=UPI0011F25FC2|nr:carboxypeptidase-like regulatory domain-containing protein [Dyadobacter sp. UC 10]KAA0989239.1 carboxypeptidase regulatory-like domain-containing protein [Dyadobacter sp. UC 10]